MTNNELDILVAQKVMNGVFPEDPDKLSEKAEVWYYIKRGKLLRGEPYLLNGDQPEEKEIFDHSWKNWSPSTDIAAAWQVIARMESLGYWAQLRTPFDPSASDSFYWCGFTPLLTTGWNGRPDNWTSAETMTLAICWAAIKTAGDETAT